MRREHHATNCDGQIIESMIVAHQTTKTGTFVCSVSWLFLLGCQYQCNWLAGKTCLRNDLLCVDGHGR